MPLTNEAALRGTLDALFYKDNILPKLLSQDATELQLQMPLEKGESDKEYYERIFTWISKRFLGYSISHVSGRFRGKDLTTHEEAANIEKRERYLIDDTTAVARFIFPCEDDVQRARWFFDKLFVQSIIQVVNGEDDWWDVLSGGMNGTTRTVDGKSFPCPLGSSEASRKDAYEERAQAESL